jgi:hypothetical protein
MYSTADLSLLSPHLISSFLYPLLCGLLGIGGGSRGRGSSGGGWVKVESNEDTGHVVSANASGVARIN